MSSLELPAEDKPAASKVEAPKEQPREESKSVPKEERTATPAPKSDASNAASGSKAQKQTYPLYPSVQHLLKVNGLPKEEADKIPASGPGGRLLKGDVLAYIGQIQNSYPAELAQRFKTLAHLDLSNIKVAAKKEAPAQKPVASAEAAVPEEEVEVALPVSFKAVKECQQRLEESIGVFLPLSDFIARACELANEELPKSKTAKPSADELFNAVLGVAGKQFSRGHLVPAVTPLMPATVQSARTPVFKKPDVLDMLTAKKSVAQVGKARKTGVAEVAVPSVHVFSVNVPKGDVKRGRVFLERVKRVLEAQPGRLVV